MRRYMSVVAVSVVSLLTLGLGEAHADKTFKVSGVAGACQLRNGVLTIHNNGKASLKAKVASTSSGSDAYCLTFKFQDGNGTEVFAWPRICSPTLYPVSQMWSRSDLAVPQNLVDFIQKIAWVNHC